MSKTSRNKGLLVIGKVSLLLALLVMVICPIGVEAASTADFTMSASRRTVNKGQKVDITITVKSQDKIAGVQSQISYDPKKLSYVGGSAKGTDGNLTLLDWDSSGESAKTSHSYQLEFNAIGTGTAKLEALDTTVIDEHADEMTVKVTNTEVTINSAANVSKNNLLSSLRVAGLQLSPEFKPNVMSYTVQAGDADELIISALAEDGKAVVTVSGNENLKPGSNRIVVTVTAQSGEKRRYTIVAEKNSSDSSDVPNDSDANAADLDESNDSDQIVNEGATEQSIEDDSELNEEEVQESGEADVEEEGKRPFWIILLGMGVLCVCGGGVYTYYHRK